MSQQDEIPEKIEGLPGYESTTVTDVAECAPGAPAKHPWGVQYQGSFAAEHDGTARAVRLHARALHAAGIPVLLEGFSDRFVGSDGNVRDVREIPESVALETEALRRADVGALLVRVKHLVISTPDLLRNQLLPRFVLREPDPENLVAMMQYAFSTTVVYSVWERTTIDHEVARLLAAVAECWVPCEQNKRLLERHGVSRVVVVPHPYPPDSQLVKLTRRRPYEESRFYAIGTWQPRKGFHELIGAFLLAFKPGDRATLAIKYREMKWPDYPSPEESVKRWFEDERVRERGWTLENAAGHLSLYGAHWGEQRILRLHFDSNIYVASSRGEAWCLPAFDAKLAGNRLVHVPFGGTADFAGPGDVPVPFVMGPVPKSYGWEQDAMWADYQVHALAESLREAARSRVDPEVPAGFEQRFGFEAVGSLMRERVLAIQKHVAPELVAPGVSDG